MKRGKPLPYPSEMKIMALNNNKYSNSKKQEKNKSVFIKKNKDVEDFLSICKLYCRKSLLFSDSPWKNNKNPIYEIKKLGINKIGKTQSKIIYFLYDYFKKGKPVYFSYKNLANELNINEKNITRNLKSLEKKNLIVKENFKSKNNGGGHQVIILPNGLLHFQNFLNTKRRVANKESDGWQIEKIFSKHSKILRILENQDLLTDNTNRYYKDLYNNKEVMLTHNCSSRFAAKKEKESSSFAETKEKKPMRLQLKRKSSEEALPQIKKTKNLRDKFKKDKTSLAKKKEKKFLEIGEAIKFARTKPANNRYIDKHLLNYLNKQFVDIYGNEYDKTSLFKSVDNLESFAGKIDNKLLFMFFELLNNDRKLDRINTIKVIKYFNEKKKDNHKFVATNIDEKNKQFKKIMIAVSYYLMNHSIDKIKKLIDRLDKFGSATPFVRKNKVNLLEALVNPTEHKYLRICLTIEHDSDAFAALRDIKTNFPGMQKDWKKIFIGMYNESEDDEDGEGNKWYGRSKFFLSNFLEQKITIQKENNLNLCKIPFTKGNSSVMSRYIEFLQDLYDKEIVFSKMITSEENWEKFIKEMRKEYSNFFKPIEND